MKTQEIPKLKVPKGCAARIGLALGLMALLGVWIIDAGYIRGTCKATFRDHPIRIEVERSWCGFTYRKTRLDFLDLEHSYPGQPWRVARMTFEESFPLITLPGRHFDGISEGFYWDLVTLEAYISHASSTPPQSEFDEFMIGFAHDSNDAPTLATLMDRWSKESNKNQSPTAKD